MMRLVTRLVALPLLALAAPVLAVDGAFEINQECAMGTGCFPGDTSDFPVTIGAAGSYRLTGNLQVPDANTDAIVITAGPVTLDLGGFSIAGGTVCTGVPVNSCSPIGDGRGIDGAFGARDITVRNGNISGMGSTALFLDFSARAEGLHVFSNGGDGIVLGNESIIWRNVVTSNFADGIRCGQRCVFRDNTSTGNRIDGLQLVSGTVTGNSSTVNGGRGGEFGASTSYAQNLFLGNVAGDLNGGHATGGNVCGDGSCSTHGLRRFYLSNDKRPGGEALLACDVGFHMASLWEIWDPSGLEYDVSRGQVNPDSGKGPPTGLPGWIRTGGSGSGGSFPGVESCDNWTDSVSGDGTIAHLPDRWDVLVTTGPVAPWETLLSSQWVVPFGCATPLPVWCVEN